MNNELLNIEKVSVVFNKDTINEVFALKDFSLRVNYGDTVIIKGGNGSGKSTLLNLIKKKVDFIKGQVSIKGVSIKMLTDYKISKYTSTIYQNPINGLCPNMTVYENLFFSILKTENIKMTKVNKKEYREIIKKHINNLNIEVLQEKFDEKIINLSGGQQQLVSLAKVSFEKPDLLLLDEPTSALDKENAEIVENLIFRLTELSEITILWVTHKDISKVINNFKNIYLTN